MAKRIVIGKDGKVIESVLPDPDFSDLERAVSFAVALSPKACGSCPACFAVKGKVNPAPVPVDEPALHTGVYL